MKYLVLLMFFALTLSYHSQAMAEKIRISVGVYSEHLAAFERAVAQGNCPHPRDYPVSDNQVLAEFLMFCEALNLGGLEPDFEFKVFPAYARLLRELNDNSITALAFGGWRRDLDEERLYISTPIIPANTFSKGIFVLPTQEHVLDFPNRTQIASLTAVSNANWEGDVESISCIGSKMVSAHSYVNMFRMVKVGRADYLITTFPAGDKLDVTFHGVTLRPVHGVKVIFKDSLHYAINKNHLDAKKIFAALESGMDKLTRDGTIRQVMADLGIDNPKTSGWKNIGCQ
uniref:hypothetical protein n=1 Tax=Cellvibrio fontiphilus TaxID=1815559 RepID=UPI002B4C0571|nr:hypothetical protein [Cellvibrio fontiphilus]